MHRCKGVVAIVALVAVVGPGIGCGGDETKEPIRIGLTASLTGFDEQWGNVVHEIVVATVDEINATGGVDGHPLELIVEDDGSEPDPAVDAVRALIDQDVVAIVGGFWSNQLEAITPIVRDAEVPLISPSSTSPALVLNPPDDGFVFRTAPNDTFQVLAMSHFLADLAEPSVSSIAIVHEDGSYGVDLAAALVDEWVADRGLSVSGSAVAFPSGMDQAAADTVWSDIAATSPSVVVFVGGGADANVLIRTWVASGELPDLQWFLADAAKQQALFGDGATVLPPEAAGLRGTAPTYPRSGLAFQTYVDVVLDRTGMDVSQEAYFPNTYDAVYLFAGGLTQQAFTGEAFGGAGLRDAINSVSRDGQISHAGQWRNFVSQVLDGENVDYDGASGPVDFDADGETISPYEVWEAQHDGTSWSFVQIEYMEADQLTAD